MGKFWKTLRPAVVAVMLAIGAVCSAYTLWRYGPWLESEPCLNCTLAEHDRDLWKARAEAWRLIDDLEGRLDEIEAEKQGVVR